MMKIFSFLLLFSLISSCGAYTITEKVVPYINARIVSIYNEIGEHPPFKIERVEYNKKKGALLCYNENQQLAIVLRKNSPPGDGFSAPLVETGNTIYVISVPDDVLYTDFENKLRLYMGIVVLLAVFGGYYVFSDTYRSYSEYRVASSMHPGDLSETQSILKNAGVRCRVSTKMCVSPGAHISGAKTMILLVHKKDLQKANEAMSKHT